LRIVVGIETAGAEHAAGGETTVAQAFVGHQARFSGGGLEEEFRRDDGHAAATRHHRLEGTAVHAATPFIAVDELIAGDAEIDLVHAGPLMFPPALISLVPVLLPMPILAYSSPPSFTMGTTAAMVSTLFTTVGQP
jgi:hypothetical protein